MRAARSFATRDRYQKLPRFSTTALSHRLIVPALLSPRAAPLGTASATPLHPRSKSKKQKNSGAAALRAARSSTAHSASCQPMQQKQRGEIET
jgi:hypothetical protein